MSKENVAAFLEKIMNDPKAAELMKGMNAATDEEKIAGIVEAAKGLGFELTAEELEGYLKEQAEERKAKTEVVAGGIEKLDDSELGEVAGGKYHSECKDTYRDEEGCFYNDGCDLIYHRYDGYHCKALFTCKSSMK